MNKAWNFWSNSEKYYAVKTKTKTTRTIKNKQEINMWYNFIN